MKTIEAKFNELIPSEFGGEMNEDLLNGCVKISGDLAIGFANWVERLSPSQKTSVWSKDGQFSGLFTMDNDQLFNRYVDELDKRFKAEKSRCCGRCDGVNDICVADIICDKHNDTGCSICFGERN